MTATTTFLTDFTEGFAQLLEDEGLAYWQPSGIYPDGQTGVYIGTVPLNPSRVVTLTPRLVSNNPTQNLTTLELQVRTRSAGKDPRDVLNLDASISDALLGRYPMILPSGVHVTTLTQESSGSMGQDTQFRWNWVSNYYAGVSRPTTHRN